MRISKYFLAVLFMCTAVSTANAASVTLDSSNPTGNSAIYSSSDDYTFAGQFSSTNTILSWGLDVGPGDRFDMIVNVPAQFDMFATVTTGINGTGSILFSPSLTGAIPAGTSSSIPFDGDVFTGLLWASVAIGPSGVSFIDSLPGGVLDFGSIFDFASSNPNFNPGGGTGTGGGIGGGPGVSAVPIPAAIWLLAGGLGAFFSVRKKALSKA